MTGDLLPIVAELAECRSDHERIAWLLACPFGILRKYDFTIRNRLKSAGFEGGDEYLDAVRVAMSSVRAPDGFWKQEQYDLLGVSIENMRAAARVPVAFRAPDPTGL